MSLTEVLNQCNNSFIYSDKSYKNTKSNNKKRFIGFKPKIQIRESYYKNILNPIKPLTKLPIKPTKKIFGFWNNPNYKESKVIYDMPKLPNEIIEIIDKPIEQIEQITEIKQDIFIPNETYNSLINSDQDITEEEIKEYIPIEQIELTNNDLAFRLNYNTQKLFDVINTFDNLVYPLKENNTKKFYEIMNKAYNLTHKTHGGNIKLHKWIDNYPNLVDNKIKAIQNKLKKKNRDPHKSRYKTSELRFKTICRKIENLGYYGFNIDSIKSKMKSLENDEIINDIIAEISDQFGNDHDMIEINEVINNIKEKW